jgi:uncharacterized protein (UPF0371 family)
MKQIKCEICGKMFTPSKRGAKCCSDECRKENKRRIQKEYMKHYISPKKRKAIKKPEIEVYSKSSINMTPLNKMTPDELLNYGKIQVNLNRVVV